METNLISVSHNIEQFKEDTITGIDFEYCKDLAKLSESVDSYCYSAINLILDWYTKNRVIDIAVLYTNHGDEFVKSGIFKNIYEPMDNLIDKLDTFERDVFIINLIPYQLFTSKVSYWLFDADNACNLFKRWDFVEIARNGRGIKIPVGVEIRWNSVGSSIIDNSNEGSWIYTVSNDRLPEANEARDRIVR